MNYGPTLGRLMLPALGFFIILVSACTGGGGGGVYTSEFVITDATKHERLVAKQIEHDSEREQIILKRNGTFELNRGSTQVWEGTWRTEGDSLYLLATSVMGNTVTASLQEEIAFQMQDSDTIVDDRMRADGYILVFRK